MERIPSPTGDAIKRKLSLSDVADTFGISRPTLYKYIDDYDRQDYSRLSSDILRLFDYVTDENTTADDAQAILLDYRRVRRHADTTPNPQIDNCPARLAPSTQQVAERDRGLRWIHEDVKVTCIGQDGRSMVIFDGPEGIYRLRLWMDIDGMPFLIAEYPKQDGKRFFVVDDVLPRPGYRFDVVCLTNEGEVSSGLQELRFR